MAPRFAHAEVYSGVQNSRGSRIPTLVWLLLVAAALAGGYFGHDYLAQQVVGTGLLPGAVSLTEGQLDNPVATYTVGEETFEVTARDALLQGSSLEAAAHEDGTYRMPSAENVISAARTTIVQRDAEAKGIAATDEELDAYTEQTFGTTDYESIGANYSMDADTVRQRLRESATMAKLREQVVTTQVGDEPQMPAAPGEGQPEANADYAAYIFGLAGDEWNADANAWASTDGPYASVLKDYDIRNDSASYSAAQAAYYVAYQQFGDAKQVAADEWTAYVNALLAEAQITLSSLVS